MGQIQSSVGLITGISIDDTITKLLAISAQPRDRLIVRNKSVQAQQTAVGELLALTIGLQLSSDRLGKTTEFSSLTASSSNKDVLSATASSTASPGTYAFRSIQTSQTASYTSNLFTSSSQALSSGEVVVRTGGFVDQSTRLENLNGGEGVARGKIEITNRSGESRIIDLRFALTADDVVSKINAVSDLKVTAKIDGDRIVLTDSSGGTSSNLKVQEVDGGITASQLGLGGVNTSSTTANGDDVVFLSSATRIDTLRDGRGIRFGDGNDIAITLRDGTAFNADLNEEDDGTPVTIGELVDRINALNPGKLSAKVSTNGNAIELVDLTSGGGNFVVSDINGKVASDLGLVQTTAGSTITGTRVQSSLQGPLLTSLKGGNGVGTLGQISVTNRNGTQTTIDLAGSITLRDVVSKINNASAGVIASLNSSKTGVLIQDSTGATSSNLKIADADGTQSATNLQIVGDVAKSSIDSGSLGLQFVHENLELSKLNQGRGVALNSFLIKDSNGAQTAINLQSLENKTIGGLIDAINATSLDVEAKLNITGDGLYLIDTGNGAESLTVSESGTGSAAKDLGILGSSKTTVIDGQSKQAIESSQNLKLTVASGDKLSDFISDINDAGGPVSASLINAGPNSVRLLVSSKASGFAGRVVLEGGTTGISFTATSQARDAIVAIGASENTGGTLVTSSTNSFKEIVTGVQLDVKGQSTDDIQVTIASSNSSVSKNVQSFVDQFNKIIDKIKTVTSFDANSKTTGILFGSTEVLRTEFALTRLVTSRVSGSGSIKSMEELGVSVTQDGKLDLDKTKLEAKLAENPDAVKSFFTTAELGFSAKAKKVIDTLSGVNNSLLVSRNQSLQSQFDANAKRIDTMNEKLDREKLRLQKQFYSLEQTIAKLQQNQKDISKIGTVSV